MYMVYVMFLSPCIFVVEECVNLVVLVAAYLVMKGLQLIEFINVGLSMSFPFFLYRCEYKLWDK